VDSAPSGRNPKQRNIKTSASGWGEGGDGGEPAQERHRIGSIHTLTRSASEGNRKPRVSSPPQRAAKVSLTMIVKNEEANLPHCLASVEGVFDEIVIVDTGSTDRTKEIAREFGAKVFDFVWIDNFAAARNEALSHATGDYIFWLDADDVVEPGQREKLVALLAGLKRPVSPPCSGIECGSAGSTPPNPPSQVGEKDRLARPVARRKVSAQPLMSCAARVTRARMGPAATRWSITSGCFRFATMFGGRIAFTNRSCRHCGGRTFR
jgi:hypothetical protein